MNGDGRQPGKDADKGLGEIVQDVSQKASLLVREEVELAKAEVTTKLKSLGRGAAVALAAGVILIFGVNLLLHGLAWLLADALDSSPWVGFAIVTGLLFLLAAVAGLLAARWIKSGAPPTPDLAIEEAKRTRAQLEAQKVERDQVGRGLEKGRELTG